MKQIKLGCLLTILVVSGMLYAQEEVALDKVIAVVGRNMVKESELEVAYLQSRYQSSTATNDKFTTKCNILETMLLNKLMLHQADIDSIVFTEQEVEKRFDELIKRNYGSTENCEKAMGKPFREIKEKYMPITKQNMQMERVMATLTADLKLTPKEVTDFFNAIPQDSLPTVNEEYEFIQIVKRPVFSQEDKDIIINRLNEYRDRIKTGTKFATLAKLYSEDPASAKKGGELGFFSRGQMVEEFETAAFALTNPDEISPVIETKYGFHILQLIERRGNQVNVRHILIQPVASNIALAKAKSDLDSIKILIDNNKISFEEAISVFSDDESKVNEGLIINPATASTKFTTDSINYLMRNIDRVNFATMNKGDITQPILFTTESGNAYRLIKIRTKTDAHKVNLHDDYDKIYNLALENQRTDFLIDWANRKVKKTYIKLDADYQQCDFKVNWTNK
ncbi:MAG: peptidylprolyl isomerase [Bacteroidales bacterium]|jgi:peptidyl-prolyl cis-trans isomerase SurA|nr:peptidylprolyl isomerase [Bacteroidales bacterium]